MTVHRHDSIAALAMHALANGGRMVRLGVVAWDISGDCSDPYCRFIVGRKAGRLVYRKVVWSGGRLAEKTVQDRYVSQSVKDKSIPVTVELATRCRKCDNCRKARAALWRLRARAEISAARRTWFGTLTLSPEGHYVMLNRARAREHIGGVDLDTLGQADQFKARTIQAAAEITLWLKRIRKAEATRFRYLVVVEAHASGLPHFHVLVHEREGFPPIRHATLSSQWRWGFTNFKLVDIGDGRPAAYVAKYLSKSALARVRASAGYGTATIEWPAKGMDAVDASGGPIVPQHLV